MSAGKGSQRFGPNRSDSCRSEEDKDITLNRRRENTLAVLNLEWDFQDVFIFRSILANAFQRKADATSLSTRRLCLHSLFGRVGELVLPLPSVTFLNPRVAPQAPDGVHVRVCQRRDLLHFHLADNGGVCLNTKNTYKYKTGITIKYNKNSDICYRFRVTGSHEAVGKKFYSFLHKRINKKSSLLVLLYIEYRTQNRGRSYIKLARRLSCNFNSEILPSSDLKRFQSAIVLCDTPALFWS